MDRTHIKHRFIRVIALYGFVLEAVAASAVLGTIITVEDVDYSAHFLQRRPAVHEQRQTSSRVSSARVQPRAVATANRVASRRAQRMITGRMTVADAAKRPYLVMADESLHGAASEAATAPIVKERSSSSTASLPSSVSSVTSAASAQPVAAHSAENFPAFGRAMHPVARVPDWGAMTTPAQWNREYGQLADEDFVRTPAYDLETLAIPMDSLLKNRTDPASIKTLTAKLYYSTRFFGAYDLDAGEFSAVHPGIDLKLAEKTPVGAVAGGRVHDVRMNERALGLHVLIEHRAPDGRTYYSIYGHLDSVSVRPGDTVTAGQIVGEVGMTGHTTGPHLHLQIDRGEPNEAAHEVYWPASVPSRAEADKQTVNPIVFVRQYADGN